MKDAFVQIFGDFVDGDTLEYCIGFLEEEKDTLDSPQAIYDAISEFVDLDKSNLRRKCEELFKLIGVNKDSVTSSSLAPQLLAGPVKVNSLIDDTVFEDKYMGLTAIKMNTNETMEAGTLRDQVKKRNQEHKEREQLLKRIEAWENQKRPAPTPVCRHRKDDSATISKVTDILVSSFSVAVAGRPLLEDAPLKLVVGRRYALVGRNGVGKSVFLSALARGEIPGVNPDLNIACVEQEIDHLTRDKTKTVLDTVLDIDVERRKLMTEMQRLINHPNQAAAATDLTSVHARLAEIESDAAPAKAAMILHGLGVHEEMQKQALASLSGGWRMRVVLARALFSSPDLLLLDEPTNHLDVHAIAWLSDYLQFSKSTCILVSHARDFINDVATDIIYFDHHKKTLEYFRGDFDTFETLRATQKKLAEKHLENQSAERAHIQKFIDRFRYNANRAALVQSRIKALQRLPMLEEIATDPSLVFEFKEPDQLPAPILRLDHVAFTYGVRDGSTNRGFTIRCDGFGVDLDSRIALVGENGSGKTTFIKILIDEMTAGGPPLEGHVTRNNRLRVGYFSQHHVDTLDVTKSAVESLRSKYYPAVDIGPETARNYLGQFGVTGNMALEPLYCLSGGQKTRVALAIIAFANPHILIMDEPTNHLDMDAVQALVVGLANFKGGVLLVSHDFHTLKCVCDEVWHAEDGVISKFKGDIDDYKKYIRKNRS